MYYCTTAPSGCTTCKTLHLKEDNTVHTTPAHLSVIP